MSLVSHEERTSRPRADCEPGNSRGGFQVREQVSDDHSERTAEPDSNSSDFGNLADQLREMVQQPVLEGSGSIDIGHLLRQLLPIDAGKLASRRRKLKRWATKWFSMWPFHYCPIILRYRPKLPHR